MFKQLIAIYSIVINFVLEIHIYESLPEISGFLTIILLLLIARRINNRRKLKKSALIQMEQGQEADFKTMVDTDSEVPLNKIKGHADDETIKKSIKPPADKLSKTIKPSDPISGPIETEPVSGKKERKKERLVESVPEKPVIVVGFLDRLKSGLSKTRQSLSIRLDTILSGSQKINDDVLEEIEEVLITSDIGVPTTMELMQRIEKKADKISNADEFKSQLKKEMLSLIDIETPKTAFGKPRIIMVVGVNGVGKTTTIGKLAAKYSAQGKKVLLSASDTFRAAAVEQLEIWANRANADIVKHRDKSDPAAVAFDSIEAALARNIDVVIVDTAGRLHTKVNLMEELKKIKRSIGKKIPSAPHETLLVLDATTGQNAVSQARLFNEQIDITGIVLTKLDGTAKGGIVLSISNALNIPIRYIGIGEGVDDLQKFDAKLFVDALL